MGQNELNGVVGKVVVAVQDDEPFTLGPRNGVVDGALLAAVLLVEVAHGEPFAHKLPADTLRVVRGTVVHDEPFKVFLCLAAEALV